MNISKECIVCNGRVKVDKLLDKNFRDNVWKYRKGNV